MPDKHSKPKTHRLRHHGPRRPMTLGHRGPWNLRCAARKKCPLMLRIARVGGSDSFPASAHFLFRWANFFQPTRLVWYDLSFTHRLAYALRHLVRCVTVCASRPLWFCDNVSVVAHGWYICGLLFSSHFFLLFLLFIPKIKFYCFFYISILPKSLFDVSSICFTS